MSATSLRLLLPELLWLEPEHFEQAKTISRQSSGEPQQWQAYLNALAQAAFTDWLQEKLPSCEVHSAKSTVENTTDSTGPSAGCLVVNGFKLRLIATEHVLGDEVALPKSAVDLPNAAAHCYAVVEVLEDQEQAEIRGFVRYDKLIEQLQQLAESPSAEYRLPLSFLDEEIGHLIGYVQHSHPSLIPLPAIATQSATVTAAPAPTSEFLSGGAELTTRLSQWLQGTLTEGWQTLDRLINPEASLIWSSRATTSSSAEARGGKLINLGMEIGRHPIALMMTVVPQDEKVSINVQALPTGEDLFLPPGLKIALVSTSGKVLQEVAAREQDNYIQLRSFKGRAGTRFSIEVTLDDVKVSEVFEL